MGGKCSKAQSQAQDSQIRKRKSRVMEFPFISFITAEDHVYESLSNSCSKVRPKYARERSGHLVQGNVILTQTLHSCDPDLSHPLDGVR